MHVAVFAAYAIPTPHFETDLELIQSHLEAGDRVTVLGCEGELPACDPNPHHDLARCLKCRGRRAAGLQLVSPNVKYESFYRLTHDDQQELRKLPTAFATVDELKNFRLGEFDIGYGVLSSLVTLTRDPNLDLTSQADLVRRLVRSAWIAHRSVQRFLAAEQVDRVYVYNGRFAPVRAVLRACQAAGVDCHTHERGHSLQHYVLYPNTTPHDLEYTEQLIHRTWEEADPLERERIARDWFQRRTRRDQVRTGEISFIGGQQSGRLPAGWDPSRRNIAIFVSSEDEYVAIGSSWDNPLYATQNEGLRRILASLADDPGDLHVYVRIHPNLADVDNEQTRALHALDAPYLTVIRAADPVSTYDLMQAADTVLTFGSTTGAEAVYWGRPSVLAGMCFYRRLGGLYVPESHDDLMALLRSNLAPQDPAGMLKYAHFLATEGEPFRHFEADGVYRGLFKGQRVRPDLATRSTIALLDAVWPQRLVRKAAKSLARSWRRVRQTLRLAG